MSTHTLSFQIGSNLTNIKAKLSLFGLSENEQTLLGTFPVTEINSEISIDQDVYSYYYALAEIQSFTSSGAPIVIPDAHNIQLFTVFEQSDDFIMMSEAVTLANAFCFTQSITMNGANIALGRTDRVKRLSLGMRKNFIATDGTVSEVITSSPNAFETNSYALWISLANLLYNAMTNPEVYLHFLSYTTIGLETPSSFFEALQNMIRNPFISVPEIYGLIENNPVVFTPSLTQLDLPHGASPQPNQWTLAIKVNNSGADNYLFAGAAYIAFDKNDRGWVANNVVQGTPNSASCCMVLEPNGKPAKFSPVFGGGIVGVGFGVTVDNSGENIYFGSFGWGPTQCNPFEGAVAQFATDGTTISPSNGWTKSLSRVQGLNFDADGNFWVTSWGSQEPLAPATVIYPFKNQESAIVVFPVKENGLPDFDNPVSFPLGNPFRATFDVAYNATAEAIYVACAGTNRGPREHGMSAVYRFVFNSDTQQIEKQAEWSVETDPTNADYFMGLRQVNFDSEGNVYVGAIRKGTDQITDKPIVSRVVKLDQNLNHLADITDQIDRPWSVTVDKNDTIFAGNFGPELVESPKGQDLPLGSTGVTVVKKNDNNQYTSNLMTLPTGGDEVTLATGFPLYGIVKTKEVDAGGKEIEVPVYRPCYSPLMRITSSSVDGAGNLWVNNNWKPSGAIDLLENPGGDGLVIFVGVAEPEPYRF
jgi:hypothetical protein